MSMEKQEIKDGVYWVGCTEHQGGLHCNPYLIVDGEEAVLIDPGSVLDFEYVLKNILDIIPLNKIKYVILHHQDPDFCASVPLFEEKGAQFQIVTHWRTQSLVKYYGVKSDYYIVNENEYKLTLKSGRVLDFLQTPYLHFPGSIVTYDKETKILFSSDLFGAFSYEWALYAGEDYMERMQTFHEHYMPSNDILRPVMEMLMKIDISMIAPQHGSVINTKIKDHIKVLMDLKCGSLLDPIKKDLAKSGGYKAILSSILKRYVTIFNKQEVLEAIKGMDITIDEDKMEVADYDYKGNVLWNNFFGNILIKKGLYWLIMIEPLVKKLSTEYDMPIPEVFNNSFLKVQGLAHQLNEENSALKEINIRLQNSIKEAEDKLTRCPVTGLYNSEFFKSYFSKNIMDLINEKSKQNPSLIIINMDNLSKIKYTYGDNEVDEVLKNTVYILANNIMDKSISLFRLQGASFACYIPHSTREFAINLAEKFRNSISESEIFIERVTVSLGVVSLSEILDETDDMDNYAEIIFNTAMSRIKLAKNRGMNIVSSQSTIEDYQEKAGRILIVDTDEVNIDVLKTFLENLQYKVFTASDGEEALSICESEALNLIICEIMIPKFDGFVVRQKLLSQSQTKNIPFIFISYLKNEDSVQRAAALQVEHYFKKPYMLSELLGLVKNKVKGEIDQ